MTAIVSFFNACRALAIGNSFRVTTSSFTPPKLIIAMFQLSITSPTLQLSASIRISSFFISLSHRLSRFTLHASLFNPSLFNLLLLAPSRLQRLIPFPLPRHRHLAGPRQIRDSERLHQV